MENTLGKCQIGDRNLNTYFNSYIRAEFQAKIQTSDNRLIIFKYKWSSITRPKTNQSET